MPVLWELMKSFCLAPVHSAELKQCWIHWRVKLFTGDLSGLFVNYLLHGSVYLYQPQHLSASAWAIFIPHWRALQYSCRTDVIFPLLLVLGKKKMISFCEIKLARETIFENWHLGKWWLNQFCYNTLKNKKPFGYPKKDDSSQSKFNINN